MNIDNQLGQRLKGFILEQQVDRKYFTGGLLICDLRSRRSEKKVPKLQSKVGGWGEGETDFQLPSLDHPFSPQ